MSVRWIIADVDGCISTEASEAWDLEHFVDFARRCRRASSGEDAMAPLTLCTGRPQPYVEVLMKLLDVRAPAICESGALFYALAGNRAWYGPGVTEEKIQGLRAVRAFLELVLLPRYPQAVYQVGKEAHLSAYSESPEIFPEMQQELESYIATNGFPAMDINSSHFHLNLAMAGVNKGNALRALLDDLGVARDETAGIGDTAGDLPLRESVRFFACPANATAEIKAVADYVSPYPMLTGMLDILDRPEFQRA